jgi:hypothetical protein
LDNIHHKKGGINYVLGRSHCSRSLKRTRTNLEEKVSPKSKIVKSTRKTGGLHIPYKGMILAKSKDFLNNPPTAFLFQAAPQRGLFLLAGFYRLTRKRVK